MNEEGFASLVESATDGGAAAMACVGCHCDCHECFCDCQDCYNPGDEG